MSDRPLSASHEMFVLAGLLKGYQKHLAFLLYLDQQGTEEYSETMVKINTFSRHLANRVAHWIAECLENERMGEVIVAVMYAINHGWEGEEDETGDVPAQGAG